MFTAYALLSFATAFLFSIVFEAPFMLLDKKYLTGKLSKIKCWSHHMIYLTLDLLQNMPFMTTGGSPGERKQQMTCYYCSIFFTYILGNSILISDFTRSYYAMWVEFGLESRLQVGMPVNTCYGWTFCWTRCNRGLMLGFYTVFTTFTTTTI